MSAGTYQIKVVDENQCSVITEALTIDEITKIDVAYNTFCFGGIPGITLTANGGTPPYQYSIDGGLTYSSYSTFDTTMVGDHLYLIVKDSKGCVSDVKQVDVTNLNNLVAGVDIISQNLCYGVNDAQVQITTTGGVPPYNFSLNSGTPTSSNMFDNLAPGEYTVVVKDSNTCPAKVTFVIDQQEPIIIELLSKNDADCNGLNGGAAEIAVSGGSAPYNYHWSNGDNSSIVANLPKGTHTVTVTDANNCESNLEIMVAISHPDEDIEVPNVFSPNGDGINDLWVIKNLQWYPENELVLINRWGNEVYTQKSYQNNWDGSQLNEGTYFYVLKVKMCNEDKKFSGYITIIK